jgi:hypothetical protein
MELHGDGRWSSLATLEQGYATCGCGCWEPATRESGVARYPLLWADWTKPGAGWWMLRGDGWWTANPERHI